MKAHTARQPAAPHGISFRLVALALVALMLQPLLLSLHSGAAFAHSHFEGQSPYQHASETGGAEADHDSHHDERDANETGDDRQKQTATPFLSALPNHQHELCCTHDKVPFLRASLPVRFGSGDGQILPVPTAASSVPVFRFDVLEGRCTRAGPADAPVFSLHLSSSLLGRAPPLSA